MRRVSRRLSIDWKRWRRAIPQIGGEARNLLAVGRLVAATALARRESRGGHFRADYPAPDPDWRRRLFVTPAPDGSAILEEPALARAAAR